MNTVKLTIAPAWDLLMAHLLESARIPYLLMGSVGESTFSIPEEDVRRVNDMWKVWRSGAVWDFERGRYVNPPVDPLYGRY